MRPVTVVGGGFSGLATAYYLSSAGIPVEIVEKRDRLGGLIATLQTPHGSVETAAVAMRRTPRVDDLCRDLGIRTIAAAPSPGHARYIHRRRPTRWPLGPVESLTLLVKYATALARGSRSPRRLETVEDWGARVLGRAATRWLVGPILQGMYAGPPASLSASLVIGGPDRAVQPARQGAVAPAGGMQELIDALERRLRARGVSIRLNALARLDGSAPAVICTAASDAAASLREVAPAASRALSTVDMLPLVRVTAFYPEEPSPRGRGVLFPRGGGIRALGVLFDRNVFPERGGQYSESWIYGGAADRAVVDLSEEELAAVMDRDRQRLCGRSVRPAARFIHRWREALPHYDLQLESVRARGFDLPPGVFLVGNYVAGIGLSMLLEQAAAVATRIRESDVEQEPALAEGVR